MAFLVKITACSTLAGHTLNQIGLTKNLNPANVLEKYNLKDPSRKKKVSKQALT